MIPWGKGEAVASYSGLWKDLQAVNATLDETTDPPLTYHWSPRKE